VKCIDNITGRTMSNDDRTIDSMALAVSDGVRQLRKYGFRLVRDWGADAEADPQRAQRDAALAACTLLGLDPTDEHLRSARVARLALTLIQNAAENDRPLSREG
jgi:hypothetical protein